MDLSYIRHLFAATVIAFMNAPLAIANTLDMSTKAWTSINLVSPITHDQKWKYVVNGQLRFIDSENKFSEENLLFGFLYGLTPALMPAVGIIQHVDRKSDGSIQQEIRYWEQLTWVLIDRPSYLITSRSRFEERENVDASEVANRFREQLIVKIAIPSWEHYFLTFGDEIFIQLNQPSWVSDRVFDQNRASVGIEIPVRKNISYEIGYLNQFQFNQTNTMNNVIYLNLSISI